MTARVRVYGVKQTIKNIDLASKRYASASSNALSKVGDLIKGESDKKVPIEDGDLIASSYKTPVMGVGVKKHLIVGYGSDYANAVHESREEKLRGQKRTSGKGTYWSPDGESAFLEKALYRNARQMGKIFKRELGKVVLPKPKISVPK